MFQSTDKSKPSTILMVLVVTYTKSRGLLTIQELLAYILDLIVIMKYAEMCIEGKLYKDYNILTRSLVDCRG